MQGATIPEPKIVRLSTPETAKLSLNFTQFCCKYGYTDDYSVLDHGALSPSGHMSNRLKKHLDEAAKYRFGSNLAAHEAYYQAILIGEIVDPSGEYVKEKLEREIEEAKKAKIASRLQIIEGQIKFLSGVGLGKRGIKPSYQRMIDELLKEKQSLGVY